MNFRVLNTIMVLTCVMLAFLSPTAEASDSNVKVTVERAQIRSKPSFESPIVEEAPMGALLRSEGKKGEWYMVVLPPNEKGFVISGYIHENQVEVEKKPAKEELVSLDKPEPKSLPESIESPRHYAKNNHVKIFANYFVPSEQSFKNIYGEGMTFGTEINIKVWKFLDLWVAGNYYTKGGQLPFTKDNTDMTLIPVGLGLKLRLKRGALNPYIGFGPVLYIYEEKNSLIRTKGTSAGFVGYGGCYFKIIGRFIVDFSVNYSYCTAKPQRIKAQLGGIQTGIGLGFEF